MPNSHDAVSDGSMIEITREQRDVLWDDAAATMDGSGHDLLNTPKQSSLEGDLVIRRRIATAMWLLDDLGWLRGDPRDRFYLTVPTTELRWWLSELDEYALAELGDGSAALADPVKEFHYDIELAGVPLEECIAETRRSCDEKLQIHSACRQLLAKVA
jgi:hypothetical protein